jgi:hypothetical protein
MDLQLSVDAFLETHWEEIVSWEGELTEEMYLAGDLSHWLPSYNHGVYVVGEYACETEGCDGCATTPSGFRTCTPRIKVGRASNMYNRLANLQCSSSRALEVLALMPFKSLQLAEQEIHRLFDGLRIFQNRRSEWFWHSPEMESLINEVSSFAEYSRP